MCLPAGAGEMVVLGVVEEGLAMQLKSRQWFQGGPRRCQHVTVLKALRKPWTWQPWVFPGAADPHLPLSSYSAHSCTLSRSQREINPAASVCMVSALCSMVPFVWVKFLKLGDLSFRPYPTQTPPPNPQKVLVWPKSSFEFFYNMEKLE